MPTFNVFDAGGKLLPDTAIRVMAAMCMPDDQRSQQSFLAAIEEEEVQNRAATRYKPPRLLEKQIDLMVRSVPEGALAGDMLLQWISLKSYTPEHASLNKIYWLCRQNSLDGWSLHNGKAVPTSKRRFQDFWTQYRGVAHLWAAWQMGDGQPEDLIALSQDNEKLLQFLGIAARLFVFVCVLQIDLGDDPYIIEARGLPDMKVTPPPPTEWVIKTLSKYSVLEAKR